MITMLSNPGRIFQQKGYVFIGDKKLFVKVYVWGTVHEVQIFMPKNTLLIEHDVKLIKDEHVYKNSHWYSLRVDYVINTTMNDALSQLFMRGHLRIKNCSDARWHLTRKQAEVASLEWGGWEFSADELEQMFDCDICDIPSAYHEYKKELDDEYFARCFAMQLCELDGYAGQPIVSGNIVVWDQNPAQNLMF